MIEGRSIEKYEEIQKSLHHKFTNLSVRRTLLQNKLPIFFSQKLDGQLPLLVGKSPKIITLTIQTSKPWFLGIMTGYPGAACDEGTLFGGTDDFLRFAQIMSVEDEFEIPCFFVWVDGGIFVWRDFFGGMVFIEYIGGWFVFAMRQIRHLGILKWILERNEESYQKSLDKATIGL